MLYFTALFFSFLLDFALLPLCCSFILLHNEEDRSILRVLMVCHTPQMMPSPLQIFTAAICLTDIWRQFHPIEREYTHYSHSHARFSRIDCILGTQDTLAYMRDTWKSNIRSLSCHDRYSNDSSSSFPYFMEIPLLPYESNQIQSIFDTWVVRLCFFKYRT